jgi:small-conductance mechanosensitive channel
MRQSTFQNPVVRVFVAIGAVLLAGIAIFVGAVVFLAFLGLAVIATVAFYIRVWWIRRRILKAQREAGRDSGAPRAGRVIEGEYKQVRREEPRDR